MHDKGVLLHAHGRQPIDYISQAIFCASQIKKFLQLPVALVTSEKNISETLSREYYLANNHNNTNVDS